MQGDPIIESKVYATLRLNPYHPYDVSTSLLELLFVLDGEGLSHFSYLAHHKFQLDLSFSRLISNLVHRHSLILGLILLKKLNE